MLSSHPLPYSPYFGLKRDLANYSDLMRLVSLTRRFLLFTRFARDSPPNLAKLSPFLPFFPRLWPGGYLSSPSPFLLSVALSPTRVNATNVIVLRCGGLELGHVLP